MKSKYIHDIHSDKNEQLQIYCKYFEIYKHLHTGI